MTSPEADLPVEANEADALEQAQTAAPDPAEGVNPSVPFEADDADAAVLPSHYEPFGIVALEAHRAGAVVVGEDAPGKGAARLQIRSDFDLTAAAALCTSVPRTAAGLFIAKYTPRSTVRAATSAMIATKDSMSIPP